MLRLTEKYFSHSRSYRYREWNNELMDILDRHNSRPDINENNETEFWFHVKRSSYKIVFDKRTGRYEYGRNYFKATKTSVGDLMIPCIELFADLIANGYMENESEE